MKKRTWDRVLTSGLYGISFVSAVLCLTTVIMIIVEISAR